MARHRRPTGSLLLLALVLVCASCGGAGDPDTASQAGEPSAQERTGCGLATDPGTSERTLEHDGLERTFRQVVPEGYDADAEQALVIVLHGLGSSGAQAAQPVEAFADEAGYVLLAPDGSGAVRHWNLTMSPDDTDDLSFLRALIADAGERLCIDPGRVYMTGMSNGGGMTTLAACQLTDVVVAFAPVAGLHGPDTCDGTGTPAPIVAFHGTEDGILAYGGGYGGDIQVITDLLSRSGVDLSAETAGDFDPQSYPSPAREAAAGEWAAQNGCDPAPVAERVAPSVRVLRYGDCEDGAEVVLYTIEGGGHTWPGSARDAMLEGFLGPTTTEIDANEIMWDFFEANQR